MTSQVSEILLLSKTAKFPLRPMDYSPWSSKNSMDRNQLKKFMHEEVDVTYIHTNFGRCDHSSFGDFWYFQKRPNFPFDPWTIVHGHKKIQSIGIGSKNSCHVDVDVTCMHTNFGGCDLFRFRRYCYFQKRPNFPFDPWTIVHGHQKI